MKIDSTTVLNYHAFIEIASSHIASNPDDFFTSLFGDANAFYEKSCVVLYELFRFSDFEKISVNEYDDVKIIAIINEAIKKIRESAPAEATKAVVENLSHNHKIIKRLCIINGIFTEEEYNRLLINHNINDITLFMSIFLFMNETGIKYKESYDRFLPFCINSTYDESESVSVCRYNYICVSQGYYAYRNADGLFCGKCGFDAIKIPIDAKYVVDFSIGADGGIVCLINKDGAEYYGIAPGNIANMSLVIRISDSISAKALSVYGTQYAIITSDEKLETNVNLKIDCTQKLKLINVGFNTVAGITQEGKAYISTKGIIDLQVKYIIAKEDQYAYIFENGSCSFNSESAIPDVCEVKKLAFCNKGLVIQTNSQILLYSKENGISVLAEVNALDMDADENSVYYLSQTGEPVLLNIKGADYY